MKDLTFEKFEECIYKIEEDYKTLNLLYNNTFGKLDMSELMVCDDSLLKLLEFLLDDDEDFIYSSLLEDSTNCTEENIKNVWDYLTI